MPVLPFDPNAYPAADPTMDAALPPVVDPQATYTEVPQEDGSSEYFLNTEADLESELDIPFDANLAEYLDDEALDEISEEVLEGYEVDLASRDGYEQSIIDSLRLLKSMPDSEDTPMEPNGCDVVHPILMEACTKTQSRASNELLPANGPVKTKIVYGEDEPGIKQKATAIQRHMNWQLTKEIPEYYKNSERAFFLAAACGDAFKKKYYDRLRRRIGDSLVTPANLVVNNKADCLEKADRITEVIYLTDFDFALAQKDGTYIRLLETETVTEKGENGEDVEVCVESDIEASEIELSEFEKEINTLVGIYADSFEGHKLIEQRVYLDLDLDPGPKPYVVTVHCDTKKVISVLRDWSESDPFFNRICAYTHYGFVPSPGFYSWGYIHLLGSSSKTMTALMRLLIDTGEKASSPILAKNADIKIDGDSSTLYLGTEKVIDVEMPPTAMGQQTVGNAIQAIQFNEPSPVLLQMLQFIDGRSGQFADSIENVMENASNYGPVGTTMALLDNAAKFFAAIHKRFHKAQGDELEAIGYLNFLYLDEDPSMIPYNRKAAEQFGIRKEYYDPYVIDIVPVSDPNVSSQAHRLAINNAKLDRALQMPNIHNMPELFKEFYKDLGVENPDRFVTATEQPQPLSPVEDIMAAANGKPIKAFPEQDHQAHVAVKQAFLQDPKMGGDQLFQQAAGAVQANIREHMLLQFQADMNAIQQVGQMNEAQAAQDYVEFAKFRAAGGASSPEIMAAQAALIEAQAKAAEVPIKVATEQRQAAKASGDLQLKARDQQIKVMDILGKQANELDKLRYEQRADKADLASKLLLKSAEIDYQKKAFKPDSTETP